MGFKLIIRFDHYELSLRIHRAKILGSQTNRMEWQSFNSQLNFYLIQLKILFLVRIKRDLKLIVPFAAIKREIVKTIGLL